MEDTREKPLEATQEEKPLEATQEEPTIGVREFWVERVPLAKAYTVVSETPTEEVLATLHALMSVSTGVSPVVLLKAAGNVASEVAEALMCAQGYAADVGAIRLACKDTLTGAAITSGFQHKVPRFNVHVGHIAYYMKSEDSTYLFLGIIREQGLKTFKEAQKTAKAAQEVAQQ